MTEGRKWRDLGAAQQAGIRCKDPVFWRWLTEEKGVFTEEMAIAAVRALCGIESRSELDKPGHSQARTKWHRLDDAFQAWKMVEHV
jgi:hypothetical protein